MSVLQGFSGSRLMRLVKRGAPAGLALVLVLAVGCQSRFVAATVENDTDQTLQTVELDYPGGSFGVSTLAPHGVYSYRFKAIGSGALTFSFADASGAARTATGPHVDDGKGGRLTVHIGKGGSVRWDPVLENR